MSNNDNNEEIQRQIELLENTAKQYLSKEALTRFYTIKSTNPQFAVQITAFICQAINQKFLKGQLNDNDFKDLLRKIQEPKKTFKIIK